MAALRALACASSALILAAAPTAPSSAKSAGDGIGPQYGGIMPPVKAVSGIVNLLMNCPHGVAHFFWRQASSCGLETPRKLQSVAGCAAVAAGAAAPNAGAAAAPPMPAGTCALAHDGSAPRLISPIHIHLRAFMSLAPPHFAVATRLRQNAPVTQSALHTMFGVRSCQS